MTAKEKKSRRKAAISTRLFETGGFDFQSRRFFAFTQNYDEFSGNIVVNSDLNCCICLKIKKYLMSLPHLPTSANFHQDVILHIQEVHQWRVRLMHSLILVWFLSSFQLPNSQCGAYSQQRCKHQYCCAWEVEM